VFTLERSYGVEHFKIKRFDLELFQSQHVVLEFHQNMITIHGYNNNCINHEN